MRNSLIADSLGFDPSVLLDENFQRRWALFRDSEANKFLQLLMEKWVAELKLQLESAKPEDLNKLQGQVQQAKRTLSFLAQTSIANEVQSTVAWLGLRK